jgi:transcription elongation factor GreA
MKQVPRIIFTQQGYDTLVDEQKRLLDERPQAVSELTKARNMGDLSENGYYKAARMKLSDVDHRLRVLKHQIRYAVIRQPSNSGFVEVGSTVILDNGKDYLIVGGYESNPSEGRLSHISPIGKALIGKKKGDSIKVSTPAGEKEFTIKEVK